jgi:hypothetical protein
LQNPAESTTQPEAGGKKLSPELEGFIGRVLVPCLVRRYMRQLARGKATNVGARRSYREMKKHEQSDSAFPYEVLTTRELAERLKVKESWVVDQSKRSRTVDPIPIFRLGKHRRYLWGSPELNAWLRRRSGSSEKSA